MSPIRLFARPMLASMFVLDGADALANPASREPAARHVVPPLTQAIPALADVDTATLVRANGAAQVVGGLLLALGRLPRLSSTVLATTLVPTTLADHRFWEAEDPGARADQRTHFFRNVSLLGGLMIAAMDTEGRPGLAWRASHAVEQAGEAADRTRREARLAARLARAEARLARAEGRRRARRVRRRARRVRRRKDG